MLLNTALHILTFIYLLLWTEVCSLGQMLGLLFSFPYITSKFSCICTARALLFAQSWLLLFVWFLEYYQQHQASMSQLHRNTGGLPSSPSHDSRSNALRSFNIPPAPPANALRHYGKSAQYTCKRTNAKGHIIISDYWHFWKSLESSQLLTNMWGSCYMEMWGPSLHHVNKLIWLQCLDLSFYDIIKVITVPYA